MILNGLREILGQRKVSYYSKPKLRVPTFGQFLEELNEQRRSSADKPQYINAIDEIREAILAYIDEHGFIEHQEVSEEFIGFVHGRASQAVQKFKVHEASAFRLGNN